MPSISRKTLILNFCRYQPPLILMVSVLFHLISASFLMVALKSSFCQCRFEVKTIINYFWQNKWKFQNDDWLIISIEPAGSIESLVDTSVGLSNDLWPRHTLSHHGGEVSLHKFGDSLWIHRCLDRGWRETSNATSRAYRVTTSQSMNIPVF